MQSRRGGGGGGGGGGGALALCIVRFPGGKSILRLRATVCSLIIIHELS